MPTDPTEPRDADDAIRRGLAEAMSTPRDTSVEDEIARQMFATRTDKENRS